MRERGWHCGGSAQYLKTYDGNWDEISDVLTIGPQWAVNLYPVVVMGEIDFKQDFAANRSTLAGYTEVNWLATWGLSAYLKLEYIDPDLTINDDHLNRIGLGTNFHPWTHVDLNLEYRQTWSGGTALLYKAELSKHELLFIVHTWF